MRFVERSVWNSFHVLSSVSCFTYVEPLENFFVEFTKYNFIVHGYGHLDKLVHEELSSLYHSVINGQAFVYFLVLGWLEMDMAKLWTTTQGRVIIVLIPIISHYFSNKYIFLDNYNMLLITHLKHFLSTISSTL